MELEPPRLAASCETGSHTAFHFVPDETKKSTSHLVCVKPLVQNAVRSCTIYSQGELPSLRPWLKPYRTAWPLQRSRVDGAFLTTCLENGMTETMITRLRHRPSRTLRMLHLSRENEGLMVIRLLQAASSSPKHSMNRDGNSSNDRDAMGLALVAYA